MHDIAQLWGMCIIGKEEEEELYLQVYTTEGQQTASWLISWARIYTGLTEVSSPVPVIGRLAWAPNYRLVHSLLIAMSM